MSESLVLECNSCGTEVYDVLTTWCVECQSLQCPSCLYIYDPNPTCEKHGEK